MISRIERTLQRLRTTIAGFRTVFVSDTGRRLSDAAAESAFFVSLAVLPIMLTIAAVLRAIRPLLGADAGPGVDAGLARLLRIVLSSRGGAAARTASDLLTGESRGLLTAGTVVSFVLLTRAFRSILANIDALTNPGVLVSSRHRIRWAWATLLAAIGLVLSTIVLAMVAVGPLLGHAQHLPPAVGSSLAGTWSIVRWPVAYLCMLGFVLTVHRVGLTHTREASPRLPWRHALYGATVTSICWLLVTLLLPVYVRIGARTNPTLGALGGGLILLVWAYLLMFSLFAGARLAHRDS